MNSLHLKILPSQKIASEKKKKVNFALDWAPMKYKPKKKSSPNAEKRTLENLRMTSSKEMVHDLINYNLKALHLRKEEYLEIYKNSQDLKDLKLIEKGDIDALSKLFSCIKGPQKKWADYIQVMKDFIAFLEEV